MSDQQTPDATTDTASEEAPQPRLQFGAIRVDPLTKEEIVSTEDDWNYGTAALVADTLGGEVYARAVSPWVRVVPADVAAEPPAPDESGDGS